MFTIYTMHTFIYSHPPSQTQLDPRSPPPVRTTSCLLLGDNTGRSILSGRNRIQMAGVAVVAASNSREVATCSVVAASSYDRGVASGAVLASASYDRGVASGVVLASASYDRGSARHAGQHGNDRGS
jgi:hypothetical protein